MNTATLTSKQAKEDGMAKAAKNKAALLAYARELATNHPLARVGITMDEVVEALVEEGKSERCLGSAAGSLFKGGSWEFTGERRRSKRMTNHARELKVWKYKG